MEDDFFKKILLAIVFVICFSGFANAQSAWVLWHSAMIENREHWGMMRAFPTYKECQNYADWLGKNYPKSEWFKQGTEQRVTVDTSYICFPDTVDPRK